MSKEKSDEYWQGYIQKQNESIEICKICRYRTKFRELEKQLADSTPNSALRELITTKFKAVFEGDVKFTDNVPEMYIVKYVKVEDIEEILKEGEK